MDIHTIQTPGLGDATYLLVHEGMAVVVDPQRDIERFLDASTQRNPFMWHVSAATAPRSPPDCSGRAAKQAVVLTPGGVPDVLERLARPNSRPPETPIRHLVPPGG